MIVMAEPFHDRHGIRPERVLPRFQPLRIFPRGDFRQLASEIEVEEGICRESPVEACLIFRVEGFDELYGLRQGFRVTAGEEAVHLRAARIRLFRDDMALERGPFRTKERKARFERQPFFVRGAGCLPR